ncbi:MAG: flippase-like domain-containing protein [Desulfohalobiaceae bacterium]|nr:flippase-like domain-containing protein [Desulfohalobiaceae bacterium]
MGTLAALVWLGYVLQDIDFHASLETFFLVSPLYIFLSFLLTFFHYACRFVRLKLWVESMSVRRMALRRWWSLYLKSIAFGSLTPARIGEFSRIVLLAPTGLGVAARSKVTFLDKFADSLYIPLGLLLSIPVLSEKLEITCWWPLLLGFTGLVFYMLVLYTFGRGLPKRLLTGGWLISLAGFTLFVFSNAFLIWGVHIHLALPDIITIIIGVGVMVSLPISFGGIGVREGSLAALLQMWKVDPQHIPVLLLFEFLLNIIFPIALYGLWSLIRMLFPAPD